MTIDVDKILFPYQLYDNHRKDLAESCITPEAAQEAGIASVPLQFHGKILGLCNYGWAEPQVESILALPYAPLNGSGERFYRFKVSPPIESKNGKAAKYLQPEGTGNRLYVPAGVDLKGTTPLYITEGEKKALCLTLSGYPCIGLPGVYGWMQDGKPIIDLDAVNFKKRDVILIFDADVAVNEKVAEAEQRLAQELIRRKARVFIKRLPYGPECAKGVDDFIRAQGVEAFKKLKTIPVKPKAAPAGASETLAADPDGPFARTPYFIQDGALYLRKETKEGPVVVPLTNFIAKCEEEITRDDGLIRSIEFQMAGTLATGQKLPQITVKAGEFSNMSWVNKSWGLAPNITAGASQKDHARAAIQHLSKDAPRHTVFCHTGWREINGVWRYLHGGGALGPGDPLQIDLGENLGNYRLPAPGGREAALASLRFLDIGPWEITAPLISCSYLAPFADLLKIDFSLWPYGPTGLLKSTLAALALCHFGNFTRTTLPGSWFSTANSLEKLTFILKDCLCVIDDFMPPANAKESHRMAETAARLIYQAGNRSARGRLAADLSSRPNRYPRCLIISTGEILLPGQRQSATARYLGIELNPEKHIIDKVRLTAAQKEAHLYPQAMAAFLEHLAPRLDETLPKIKELWQDFRGAFQSSAHLRIPEILAWLAVGFELFLRFQTIMGAITEDDAFEMHDRAWRVFEALGEKHGKIIEGEKPSLNFMAILQELFLQKRIYVESAAMAGLPPQAKNELGWEEGTDPPRNAELIGWADEEFVYLLPEMAVKVVHETIRRQGDFFSLGKNETFSALVREGFIEAGKEGNTRIKRIQGKNKRVLFIPLEKLAHSGRENDPAGA